MAAMLGGIPDAGLYVTVPPIPTGPHCTACHSMSSRFPDRSVVTYRGFGHGSDCGYCGSCGTKKSRGMWAHTLTVQDYEDLIDRNWRRSGSYCYQPMMKDTCCPQYMIYCDSPAFHPSRHQRKLIHRMNRFLAHGECRFQAAEEGSADPVLLEPECPRQSAEQPNTEQLSMTPAGCTAVGGAMQAAITADTAVAPRAVVVDDAMTVSASDCHGSFAGVDATGGSLGDASRSEGDAKVKGKKAKQLRRERKLLRQSSRGDPSDIKPSLKLNKTGAGVQNSGQSLEDLLDEHKLHSDPIHRLELRLVQSTPRSSEFQSTLTDEYNVYREYQMVIHKDSSAHCTQEQFERFLVESPLLPLKINNVTYGTFHYQYILDGQVIAVEVMDILPKCISSKYFFYDPKYSFLSLGTYSALCGIRLARDLQRQAPDLSRYLMGYYIHSCQKMRYKAQFKPSFLLCPETYCWVPLETCLPLLDASLYARLSSSSGAPGDTSNDATVWHRLRRDGCVQTCRSLPENTAQSTRIAEYLALVGSRCSSRLLLFEP